MKQRYMELYRKMAESKDVAKMRAFGDAEVWIFGMLVDKHPELAQKWLDKLEASEWTTIFPRARQWMWLPG